MAPTSEVRRNIHSLREGRCSAERHSHATQGQLSSSLQRKIVERRAIAITARLEQDASVLPEQVYIDLVQLVRWVHCCSLIYPLPLSHAGKLALRCHSICLSRCSGLSGTSSFVNCEKAPRCSSRPLSMRKARMRSCCSGISRRAGSPDGQYTPSAPLFCTV